MYKRFHFLVALTLAGLWLAPLPLLAQNLDDTTNAQTSNEKWDVQTSLGFNRTIEFETREGTWMNLDVSPGGQWIVFDMLGDLYRLPIDGGTAEPVTQGPAFDQLPRISPDGKTIAFISDRSGADQLWLMNTNGSNLRQVTRVKKWFPTNPYWTPDGNYIVVKRHVRDRRSLGGGAIWMYHRWGGEGVSLVEHEGFTSDKNEPSVSPDGQWVYYSHAGPFDYNRDVHAGIFQVSRYNRSSGKTQPVTRGTGGAVRPVPSPDGQKLAFVRRVDTSTVLFVRNLETGEEQPVFSGLSHDQMETWTVHGAYPSFDWLPNSKAVVIFHNNQIHRVNVQTGSNEPVPFQTDVSVPVTETVDFDQDPGLSSSFKAQSVRWPVITPDGSHLVFQAVGSIWQMPLPEGTPQRVTTTNQLEYAPAISPDGQWLAFTTWDADAGGALWKVRLEPGEQHVPQKLTEAPNQYANPAWSPDGSRIAFVQGSGRANRGQNLSAEFFLEIGWTSAAGDSTRLVTTTANRGPNRRMPRISWSPDGQRILFHENEDGAAYLTSITTGGLDERHLVKNKIAEEIVPSPNGKYVAFKELHNVYVAPLPRAGQKPVTITRNNSPTPVKQLSRYGGNWVGWRADGTSVYWSLGAAVVQQSLEDIFADADSSEASSSPPAEDNLAVPGDRYTINLQIERSAPEKTVALTGGRIITMNGNEVIENGSIVVTGNRIQAVGPADQVEIPSSADTVDISGKTVIPGLINVHAHMGYLALDINPERLWQYYANLAYGVTTTHDPSASTQLVFSNRELVEAGRLIGPRIFSTGYILYGAKSPNRAVINSPEDALGHLRRLKAQGAFSVKSYNQLRRDVRQWIIQAARKEQMMVYPEGGSFLQQNLTQMIDGHTGIEHALPVAKLGKDAITLFAESGTDYTPTLMVGYGGVWGENYWYQKQDVYANERLSRFVPPGVLDARARRRMLVPEEEFFHFDLARTAHRIVEAGGQVQLGGHGQLQGLGPHWELWMFEQGGMTPMEALYAATAAGAEYLGMEDHLGSLQTGYLADLVVLDKNPLENIRNTTAIHRIMKNGFLYNENVDKVWPEQNPRGTFRFEQ